MHQGSNVFAVIRKDGHTNTRPDWMRPIIFRQRNSQPYCESLAQFNRVSWRACPRRHDDELITR
jgi:hypothetical protein